MRAALCTALSDAVVRTALIAIGPVVLLLLSLLFQLALLALLAVGAVALLGVPVSRVVRLRRARRDPEIVQALGPVRAVEHQLLAGIPFLRSHRLEIGDVDTLASGGAAFSETSAVGEPMHVPLNEEGEVPLHDAVFDLTALATYSRTGGFLLELRRPNGELIYADPAYAGEDSDA
jgi:hypothetical protein